MSLFAYRVLNSGHPRQKILPLAGRRRTGIAVALVLAVLCLVAVAIYNLEVGLVYLTVMLGGYATFRIARR